MLHGLKAVFKGFSTLPRIKVLRGKLDCCIFKDFFYMKMARYKCTEYLHRLENSKQRALNVDKGLL